MASNLYSTLRWRVVRRRALDRDQNRCTVSRLLGGECGPGPLHVHHIVPVNAGGDPYLLDNVGTTCAVHHPTWESLRTLLAERAQPKTARCPHKHRTPEAREICEARRARQLAAQQTAKIA